MLRNHCTAALRDNDRFHIVVRSAVDLQLRVVVLAGAKSSLPARELVVLVERHLVGWRQARSGRDRLKQVSWLAAHRARKLLRLFGDLLVRQRIVRVVDHPEAGAFGVQAGHGNVLGDALALGAHHVRDVDACELAHLQRRASEPVPRPAAQGAHQLRHGHLEINAEVVPVLRTGVHDDVRDDFHGEEALELQEEERHHHDGGDD